MRMDRGKVIPPSLLVAGTKKIFTFAGS